MWHFLQRLVQHDPAPVLANLHCPVLAIFGAEDRTVPVDQSVAEFEHGMAKARNYDLMVRIFPGANHGMRVDTAGTLAPGYLESIAQWVLDREGQAEGVASG
jgi:pimeloyl-ACP methyl ester carboxylesterase